MQANFYVLNAREFVEPEEWLRLLLHSVLPIVSSLSAVNFASTALHNNATRGSFKKIQSMSRFIIVLGYTKLQQA
jgi:hypothetical protein